jgi:hypothetical protein
VDGRFFPGISARPSCSWASRTTSSINSRTLTFPGIRYQLGAGVERASEPGYSDILALAQPYVDAGANELVILNVARMVDCARRGAHGIINAISFHCMIGTVFASLTERIAVLGISLEIRAMETFGGRASLARRCAVQDRRLGCENIN